MPFDQLILPLLGGYFFVTRFNGTAYRCASYSGHKLIFSSAFAGVFFGLLAFGVIQWMGLPDEARLVNVTIPSVVFAALALLVFGSYGHRQALSQPVDRNETESEGEFAKRENTRRVNQALYSLWLIASALLSLAVAVYIFQYPPVAALLPSLAAVLASLLLSVWGVMLINTYADLRAYALSFRLGSVLLALVVVLLVIRKHRHTIADLWEQSIPIDFAGVAFVAMVLGIVAVLPCNWLFPYRAAIRRLFTNRTLDGMESLFYHAGTTFQQIMVTLKSGKVYIGYVDGEVPISGRSDGYVTIVPTASGHRETDTRRLSLTTFYADAVTRAEQDGQPALGPANLGKVIPLSEIVSAGVFDPDFFEQFDVAADSPARGG